MKASPKPQKAADYILDTLVGAICLALLYEVAALVCGYPTITQWVTGGTAAYPPLASLGSIVIGLLIMWLAKHPGSRVVLGLLIAFLAAVWAHLWWPAKRPPGKPPNG